MFAFRFMKGMVVSLATLGVMVPQWPALADTPQTKAPVEKTAQVARIPDLILTEGGTMTGRVCDHSGHVLEGSKVTLKHDDKVIGTTITDKEGLFSFKNLKTGIYQTSAGNTDGVFRCWNEKVAPPTAKGHALLVMGENGARGQASGIDPTLVILTAGVIAGVVLGAIAINKIDNVSNQISNLPASP